MENKNLCPGKLEGFTLSLSIKKKALTGDTLIDAALWIIFGIAVAYGIYVVMNKLF